MIFVTIGVLPFPRLIIKMDEIASRIDEEIIMQIGSTKYKPNNAKYFTFKERYTEIQELNKKARVVVCPASGGSLMTAIEQGTPVVVVPRLERFKENLFDDDQLVKVFDNEGLLAGVVYDIDELEKTLEKVKVVPRYMETTNKERLITFLRNYFDEIGRNK
jgi:beta-1,4-N-acetylglucosaminyltransferase